MTLAGSFASGVVILYAPEAGGWANYSPRWRGRARDEVGKFAYLRCDRIGAAIERVSMTT